MNVLDEKDVEPPNRLAEHVYEVAKSKGFHPREEPPLGDMLSNLHGEVSELWEAYRKNGLHDKSEKSAKTEELGVGSMTNAEEELADILIRCLDTARTLGVDLAKAVRVKDAYNQTRPHRHGGKLA